MVIWVRVTRGGSSALDLLLDAAGARHHSPADWRCWQAGCRLPSCRVSSSKRKGGADCGCVDLVTYSRSKEPRAFFKRGVLHCVHQLVVPLLLRVVVFWIVPFAVGWWSFGPF